MSDYPEALVEKVAAAILDNFNPPDDRHPSWWINPEKSARAALDALGLREETRDIYRDGDGLEFVLVSNPQDYAHFNQRRFVAHTDWEDA